MKLSDTKYTLLAVAAAALLGAGCAEDDGLGEGGGAFEQGAQDEGALGEPGGARDEGAFGDRSAEDPAVVRDQGADSDSALGGRDASEPGLGQQDEVAARDQSDSAVGADSSVGEQGSEVASAYPSFEEIDTNSDGMIGRQELASIEGLDFDSLDTNQDGSLSQEEYAAAQQQ